MQPQAIAYSLLSLIDIHASAVASYYQYIALLAPCWDEHSAKFTIVICPQLSAVSYCTHVTIGNIWFVCDLARLPVAY